MIDDFFRYQDIYYSLNNDYNDDYDGLDDFDGLDDSDGYGDWYPGDND